MTKFKAFALVLGVLSIKLGEFKDEVKAEDFQDEVDINDIIDALGDIQIYSIGRQVKKKELVSSKRIETIVFNHKWGLHKQQYVYQVEVTSVVEEALEVLGYKSEEAREIAKRYVQRLPLEEVIKKGSKKETITILNKAAKLVEKLGYDNEQVLQEIEKQNASRKGTLIDGKMVKDRSPEALASYYKPVFEPITENKLEVKKES